MWDLQWHAQHNNLCRRIHIFSKWGQQRTVGCGPSKTASSGESSWHHPACRLSPLWHCFCCIFNHYPHNTWMASCDFSYVALLCHYDGVWFCSESAKMLIHCHYDGAWFCSVGKKTFYAASWNNLSVWLFNILVAVGKME